MEDFLLHDCSGLSFTDDQLQRDEELDILLVDCLCEDIVTASTACLPAHSELDSPIS